LAHSRGPAATTHNYSAFNYAADECGRGAIMEGVRVELGSQVDFITKGKGGVRRWLVFVDPGIGFSKSTDDNCRLVARLQDLTDSVMIGHGWFFSFPFLIFQSPLSHFTHRKTIQKPNKRFPNSHRFFEKKFSWQITFTTACCAPNASQ